MYLGQLGFHILSTPTPPEEGWGRQTVDTVLVNIWTGIACDATRIGNIAMHLDQVGFHVLSTPTPSEEGWGRENVETDLVNIWTGVACDATSIGNLRCILTNLAFSFRLAQPLPKRVGRDKMSMPSWSICVRCLRCYARCVRGTLSLTT